MHSDGVAVARKRLRPRECLMNFHTHRKENWHTYETTDAHNAAP